MSEIRQTLNENAGITRARIEEMDMVARELPPQVHPTSVKHMNSSSTTPVNARLPYTPLDPGDRPANNDVKIRRVS